MLSPSLSQLADPIVSLILGAEPSMPMRSRIKQQLSNVCCIGERTAKSGVKLHGLPGNNNSVRITPWCLTARGGRKCS